MTHHDRFPDVCGSDAPTAAEYAVLDGLRRRGHAVAMFTPSELRGADSSHVQDIMVERGWAAIDTLAD